MKPCRTGNRNRNRCCVRQRLSRHATTFAVRQLGGRQNRRPNLFRKELSEAFKCLKKLEKLQKQLISIEENLRIEKEKEQFRRNWDEALRRVYGEGQWEERRAENRERSPEVLHEETEITEEAIGEADNP